MSSAASDFYNTLRQKHYQARDAALKLVAHWEREHEAMINGLHPEVRLELAALMLGKAKSVVARGLTVLALREGEFDEMMRRFVSQRRRARHGPVEHLAPAVVVAQREALCGEYGWRWVEGGRQRVMAVKPSAPGAAKE